MNTFPIPYRNEECRPARWRPLDEPGRLVQEMDRLFGRLPFAQTDLDAFVPPADVTETDEAYLFELDLPGVDKGDVRVEATGRRLTVRGQRREGERKGILHRRGRVTGSFEYAFVLPADIDPNSIRARLANGVLTLEIPKGEGSRARTIPID